MKIPCLTVIALLLTINAFAQKPDLAAVADSIEKEGKMLYRSEMASCYGADVYLARFKDRRAQLGGYLSYETEGGVNNILLTKGADPIVMATITFNDQFDVNNCKMDTISRKLNKQERQLFSMRNAALSIINKDTATFKLYPNTTFNLIPVNYEGKRRVYIITGTNANGVVLIGNDHMLEFDAGNNLLSKKRFHNSLLTFKTGSDQFGGVHSHLPQNGQYMSATDICTLMLYKKFANWKQHTVICKDYVSIFDLTKDKLVILTMDAWKRINSDVTQPTTDPKKPHQ